MKVIIIMTLFTLTVTAFAKEINDFNKMLIKDVQTDIKNQNDDQFKSRSATRGPASVVPDVEGSKIEETQKLEKPNFRQIGPNKW